MNEAFERHKDIDSQFTQDTTDEDLPDCEDDDSTQGRRIPISSSTHL